MKIKTTKISAGLYRTKLAGKAYLIARIAAEDIESPSVWSGDAWYFVEAYNASEGGDEWYSTKREALAALAVVVERNARAEREMFESLRQHDASLADSIIEERI